MKKLSLIVFFVWAVLMLNSCAYTNLPFTYKLTRGDWQFDTTHLKYNQLPVLVKDTLTAFYKEYYSSAGEEFPELISLEKGVDFCLKPYVTFPPDGFFQITGYHFIIGKKKYFFDYGKFKTPIVYFDNALYYFSGKYSVKKDRNTFEAQSDFKNKIFVRYNLLDSNLRKHRKGLKQNEDCIKTNKYDFTNTIVR